MCDQTDRPESLLTPRLSSGYSRSPFLLAWPSWLLHLRRISETLIRHPLSNHQSSPDPPRSFASQSTVSTAATTEPTSLVVASFVGYWTPGADFVLFDVTDPASNEWRSSETKEGVTKQILSNSVQKNPRMGAVSTKYTGGQVTTVRVGIRKGKFVPQCGPAARGFWAILSLIKSLGEAQLLVFGISAL